VKAAPPGWKTDLELQRLHFQKNHFGAEINFYESFFLNFPGPPLLGGLELPVGRRG
jgi:hypothetical protein